MSSSKVDGGRVLHPDSVLITGANRGLGLEMVKQLLELPQPPSHLIVTCRQPAEAQALQEIAKLKPAVKILEFDVQHFDKVPALVEQVKAIVGDGGLNLLINNAGISKYYPGGLDDTPPEGFSEHLNVHIAAPFALVKGLLPLLKAAAEHGADRSLDINKAAIVNVSSVLGSIGEVNPQHLFPFYAYRTAKAGMNMMTRLMGLDLAQHGILALAIHPGWVQTDGGGPNAPLKVDESISMVLHVVGNVTAEHAGQLIGFDGHIIQW